MNSLFKITICYTVLAVYFHLLMYLGKCFYVHCRDNSYSFNISITSQCLDFHTLFQQSLPMDFCFYYYFLRFYLFDRERACEHK